MQKWEYLFAVGDYVGDTPYLRFENGQEVANWKRGQPLYAYANDKGKQGWELVSAPYTGGSGAIVLRLIFKRPLE